MAHYVIGDIQGCFQSLQALLQKIQFDETQDRLWLTGDLVNRGPRSLEVLRWARSLGDRLVSVLGNHDLHLLARFWGIRPAKPRDTLDEILAAPDAAELVEWLRGLPLVYREGPHLMIHAGLLPHWGMDDIEAMARSSEEMLRSDRAQDLVRGLYGTPVLIWNEQWKETERLSAFVKILTRIRVCSDQGEVDFSFTGTPERSPSPYQPWFSFPHRRPAGLTVFCGHWSALGFRRFAEMVAVDSGCVWGRRLTAYRIDDGRAFQVNYSEGSPTTQG